MAQTCSNLSITLTMRPKKTQRRANLRMVTNWLIYVVCYVDRTHRLEPPMTILTLDVWESKPPEEKYLHFVLMFVVLSAYDSTFRGTHINFPYLTSTLFRRNWYSGLQQQMIVSIFTSLNGDFF